ncbi:hypothetical protein [Mucisphaera sp.]|uniref:hypothetical protein n=1 Tax=Mucisphaera sp. TaxID=2913024 RepID=UPI003D1305BD
MANRHARTRSFLAAALTLPLIGLAAGCQGPQPTADEAVTVQPPKPAVVEAIELAHGAELYHEKSAVQADFEVVFGGNNLIAGTMLFNNEVSKARMDLEDGTVLVFDGNNAWVSPEDAEFKNARFHLLTWPYFLAAPMKLSDPGVNYKELDFQPLDEQNHLAAVKMTFDAGVGDAPDDWYILLKDPDTDALRAMAYIVTYGKDSVDEATSQPGIIEYANFKTVEGVAFSTEWAFSHWDPELGKQASKGTASISNIRFVDAPRGTFVPPFNARVDELPPPPARPKTDETAHKTHAHAEESEHDHGHDDHGHDHEGHDHDHE